MVPRASQEAGGPRPPSAYADLTVDYAACPLVRMSASLGESKLECCGAGKSSRNESYVKFIVRKEGRPTPPAEVLRFEGVEERYEGDGFYAYRFYTPPCANCYVPLFASHGFVPLKAVATDGELHIATLVEDLDEFKALIRDLRAGSSHPRVNLLTHEPLAHTGAHKGHPALDELTPRQRQVAESAYRAGYFHGKELDVEKLSQEIGMSVSTYYSHLRLASHKILHHVLSRTEP